MEKSSFFDAVLDSATGTYDREYTSDDFATYFRPFLSNGVFPNPSTGLKVVETAPQGMSVSLSPGFGFINGRQYENTAPLVFKLDVADGVLNRKDAIMIRYDKLKRDIYAVKVKGTPGSVAAAPAPVRTDDFYDLCVAIINVNAGITKITDALIEDKRLDTSVCGIVTGLITQVDTTTLYNQIKSDLAQFKAVSQADFNKWFADINAKLTTEPATALQLQVDKLKDGTTPAGKATYAAEAGKATTRTLVDNDFLSIDTTKNFASENMKPSIFGSATADTTYANCPPGVTGIFYGHREVSAVHNLIVVTLIEAYPVRGRTWVNVYDQNSSAWGGWVANGASAPENHAVESGTYGVGNGALYGHVKLSDSVGWESTAAGGFAATPKAVKTVSDAAAAANANANSRMPSSGGIFSGNIFAGARILAAPEFEHVYNTCIQTAGGAANVSSRLILMYRK